MSNQLLRRAAKSIRTDRVQDGLRLLDLRLGDEVGFVQKDDICCRNLPAQRTTHGIITSTSAHPLERTGVKKSGAYSPKAFTNPVFRSFMVFVHLLQRTSSMTSLDDTSRGPPADQRVKGVSQC